MDPNAALVSFARLRDMANNTTGDPEDRAFAREAAVERAQELFVWLARGGFAPDWAAHVEDQ